MNSVGIDLGTCYSSIAIIEGGKPLALKSDDAAIGHGYPLLSAVYVEEDGNILIGQAAENRRMTNPDRFRKEFKRDLGSNIPYQIGQKSMLPEDLFKELLKHFKKVAEKNLGEGINRAVVTYPAHFGGYKRNLISKSALMAGFTEVELLDEPTASAIYYSSKEKVRDGEKILVYDLGGGTFDLSLVVKEGEGFRVLTEPEAIERCGGIDFDKKILNDILETFKDSINPILNRNDLTSKRFLAQIEGIAIKVKYHLSVAKEAIEHIAIPGSSEFKEYSLSREKFETMIHEEISQTCKLIEKIVKKANIKMQDIDRVLLVGGSSRIPYVEEMVRKTVGKTVYRDADPELSVCFGAAIKGNFADAYLKRGIAYGEKGLYDNAISDYNKAIEIDPGNANAYFERGIVYGKKDLCDNAISDYNKAIEINPRYANAYVARGHFYIPEGLYDNAISDYNKAIEINPRYADAYLVRGIAYGVLKGLYDNAISDFNKAIEIDPGHAFAYFMRGHNYALKGLYDNAISDFNKAIEINPRYTDAYLKRELAYDAKGLYDNTISDFNKVIEIDPGYADAYFMRGIAYGKKGLYDNAISDFNKAIEINPGHADAYLNRGYAYAFKGEYDKAWENVYKAQGLGHQALPEFLEALRKASGRRG